MDFLEAVRANLLSPAVLFFALGIFATLVKSDLKFPEPLYVALTIYLLVSVGLKGGVALAEAGLGAVWLPVLASIALGALIPLWTYPLLRGLGRLSKPDAAAIAAHYGSVSAVTFVAATNFLKEVGVPAEHYTAAFLAVMESPAIVVGILLGKSGGESPGGLWGQATRRAFREAIFGRGVILLLGSLAIGGLCGRRGMASVEGFFVTPFQGVLALFLLEMGMVAARRLGDLRKVGPFLVAFGVCAPVVHGLIGALLGTAVGLGPGGTTVMGVLAASASYIAAPAAMRLSLPDANPTLYLAASLAVTFPFNITVGIPLYYAVARWLHSLP